MISLIIATSILGAIAADVSGQVSKDPVFRELRSQCQTKGRPRRQWVPRIRGVAAVPNPKFRKTQHPVAKAYLLDREALQEFLKATSTGMSRQWAGLLEDVVESLMSGEMQPEIGKRGTKSFIAAKKIADRHGVKLEDRWLPTFPLFQDDYWVVQVEGWCWQCLDCGYGPYSDRRDLSRIRGMERDRFDVGPPPPPYGSADLIEACIYESDLRRAVLQVLVLDPNGPPSWVSSLWADLWLPSTNKEADYTLVQVSVWRKRKQGVYRSRTP